MSKKNHDVNNSQGDVPCILLNVLNGSEEAEKEFIEHYIRQAIFIILYVKKNMLNDKNNKQLYCEFQDKLPSVEELAWNALKNFIKILRIYKKKDFPNAWKDIWAKMHKAITDYAKNFFEAEFIKDYIHNQLKSICQQVKQGSWKAEEMLRDYEKNVFIIIQDKSSPDFLYSDHNKVAQLVINEFVNQVKRNGTKDSKGNEVKNYYYYITRIIKARMYDQRRRENRVFGNSYTELQETKLKHEQDRNKDILESKTLEEGIQTLNPIERLVIIKYFKEEKKSKEIIEEIKDLFGKKISLDKFYRIKEKALKKLHDFFESKLKDRKKRGIAKAFFSSQKFNILS